MSGMAAITPVGWIVRVNAATTIASVSGKNLPVAIARSTSTHASSVPTAMIGSTRSPLLNGIHTARNTRAAAQIADCDVRTA
ncbi:Uncharacterised protein [Mycobacteroides abscessus subsp. abscessus]|nr:Uncharacterised protein [Mycobacteroides abscessus subsp. abscessus]